MKYTLQKIGLAAGLGLVGLNAGCSYERKVPITEGITVTTWETLVRDNQKETCKIGTETYMKVYETVEIAILYPTTMCPTTIYPAANHEGKPIPGTTRTTKIIKRKEQEIECQSFNIYDVPRVLREYTFLPDGTRELMDYNRIGSGG